MMKINQTDHQRVVRLLELRTWNDAAMVLLLDHDYDAELGTVDKTLRGFSDDELRTVADGGDDAALVLNNSAFAVEVERFLDEASDVILEGGLT